MYRVYRVPEVTDIDPYIQAMVMDVTDSVGSEPQNGDGNDVVSSDVRQDKYSNITVIYREKSPLWGYSQLYKNMKINYGMSRGKRT